jgi:hypothetical protein
MELGCIQLPIQWLLGEISEWIKRHVREANGSPPTSTEVKNAGAIPPLPHTSSWHRNSVSTETTSLLQNLRKVMWSRAPCVPQLMAILLRTRSKHCIDVNVVCLSGNEPSILQEPGVPFWPSSSPDCSCQALSIKFLCFVCKNCLGR